MVNSKIPTPPLPKNIESNNFKKEQSTSYKEYIYGIKDLSICNKTYERASVFISKPYTIEGNVMQVLLDSKESFPTFLSDGNLQSQHTSVEYYITHTLNPSNDQWYAILPEWQQNIKNEYLLFDDTKRATLRFFCDTNKSIKIYKDGVRLNEDEWALILSESVGHQVYILDDFTPHAYYTIDYHPDSAIRDPWVVDFQKLGAKPVNYVGKDGEEGELFNGTDHNGKVSLNYYPYIDYDSIYKEDGYDPNKSNYTPISVILEDANIIAPANTIHKVVYPYSGEVEEGRAYTKNITDYHNTEKDYTFTPYDPIDYPFFEYYQKGRNLFFSDTFNRSEIVSNHGVSKGNANVKVSYEYLVSNVRIKIILRRMDTSNPGITPMVEQYSLKFKVMR